MPEDEENSDFFTGLPRKGCEAGDDAAGACGFAPVSLRDREALAAMSHDELVAHALNVQDLFRQAEEDNKFLSWEFKEYNDNLTYFSQAAKLAHKLSAADLDTIASVAVNEVPEYFKCNFAAFFVHDAASQMLTLHRSTLPMPTFEPLHAENDAEHLIVQLLYTGSQPFIAEYSDPNHILLTDDEQRLSAHVDENWHQVLGDKAIIFPLHVKTLDNKKPLMLGGLLVGGCCRELEARDAEVAIFFGDLLSSSLYNAKLVQQLNDLTIIEPLTQIYNRRYLVSQLSSAMVQARRHRHKLSIAMLDIDHFKRFNDTYGHLCGDEVLREVADVLKNSVRANVDIPARYGGEEFMLVMPFTDLESALDVADRVRRKVKAHTFSFERYRMSVTCSIGVAEYIHDESLEEFIDRADACLYHAKRSGRDQVCGTPNSREG